MTHWPLRRLLQVAPLVALSLVTLVQAQDTPSGHGPQFRSDGVLEEVVVTARRRDEAFIDVPMAISRIDGELMEQLQYRDIREFLGLSPGLLVYGGGDQVSSRITIRGVVTPGFLVQPGNAVYVDELYASGMLTVLPGFYDIESVQVLKGPQASLYGRNTTGGAVVITTGKPTEERSARLDLSYAQLDTVDTSATFNLPLGDALQARATAWYSDSEGGYYRSQFSEDNPDAYHQSGGRLTLAVLPAETIALTLSGEYAEDDRGATPGVVSGAPLGPPELGVESRRNVLRDDPGTMEIRYARTNGKLEADVGFGTLVALAGWREATGALAGSDSDGSARVAAIDNPLYALRNTRAPTVQFVDLDDTTREAELHLLTRDAGPLTALVGVNYFEESLRFGAGEVPLREFAQVLEAIGFYGTFEFRGEQDTRAWAAFGELIWAPRESLEVTADLRYTRERQEITTAQSVSGFYIYTGSYVDLDLERTYENLSPGLTLAWKPRDTLTFFGKYARGFRAGGFNPLVSSLAPPTYDAEESENFELGGKALLFDQRLEIGASIFYLCVDDALLPQPDPGAEINPIPAMRNIGTATTLGLEVDLAAQLSAGLSISASAGRYDYDFSGGPAGYNQRAFVPDYTASLTADYQRPLAGEFSGLASLGFRYRSAARSPAGDGFELGSYNLLDAQLGIRWRATELAVFVRNALDDQYKVSDWNASLFQRSFIPDDGSYTGSTHSIVRDPGAIYGVRLTISL